MPIIMKKGLKKQHDWFPSDHALEKCGILLEIVHTTEGRLA